MATKRMGSAKSAGDAVPVNITERQVEQAIEASFNDAVARTFEMYDRMLENTPPGQRGQLVGVIYEMLSHSLSDENLGRFPAVGSPEEDTFRLSQLGPSAQREFHEWANRMRRETEDSLSGILSQAINRVRSGTVPSVEFSIRPLSEEQRQFAYMVFDSFATSQSLQPPPDYVAGQPYSGAKRGYSSEDASSRRIPALIEFGTAQVTVVWPPWLYGQTSTDIRFD